VISKSCRLSVHAESPLGQCFLCKKAVPWVGLALLDGKLERPAVDLINDRFGKGSRVGICSSCECILDRAIAAAAVAHMSTAGKLLIASSQAFSNRDRYSQSPCFHGEAKNGEAEWHLGVLMHQTCNWEPTQGRTASLARDAFVACSSSTSEEQKLQAVFSKYVYRSVTASSKVTSPTLSLLSAPLSSAKDSVYKKCLKENGQMTKSFFLPFCHLMTLSLPFNQEIKKEALTMLRKQWCTSYGGGKILNALLFQKERIVPESCLDLRGLSREACLYSDCLTNSIFGLVLLQSPFGQAVMATSWGDVDRELLTDLQRFLFKLCELRKANTLPRQYYGLWSEAKYRKQWLKDHTDEKRASFASI
jgi:hypothetical protein